MAAALLAAALAGCATPQVDRAGDAATAPLHDLNLLRRKIPDALLAAQPAPYRAPALPGCASSAAELAALDDALGADLDAPKGAAPGLIERGIDETEDAAFDALRRTAEGVVPMRGWVRKLSGAERHSRKVAAAVTAGAARRAYLKGWRAAAGCEPAAST